MIYTITYYLKENHDSCGCGDHEHHHHHVRDDYEVTAHIKELGSWAHFMPNSFLLKSELTSVEILSKLESYIEDGDMIFVNKVDKDNVASSSPNVIDWINK